jgi:hypothetical protein
MQFLRAVCVCRICWCSDMSYTDFKATRLMRTPPPAARGPSSTRGRDLQDRGPLTGSARRTLLQSSVDWRTNGKVSGINDQGSW